MPVTILLTAVAMIAFAANSLLARAALAGNAIDAVSYTTIRLWSGALALAVLLALRGGGGAARYRLTGNWPSAFALFAYAIAFSLAYLRLGAATGALILFASVQGTMIAWGVMRRDRPTLTELAGLAIAFAAFVYLLLPGLDTPDLIGSGLMMSAGIAWGVYSLRGRRGTAPLDDTAGNFLRAALVSIPLIGLMAIRGHITTGGIILATASGVLASGLGYAVWYRALPRLSTTQGASVQLTVPVVAAIGAVIVLSESLSPRLAIASLCILGGVGVTILARRPVAR